MTRLIEGQTKRGLWDYQCVKNAPGGDLSLTQFAVLALWVARKHKAPADKGWSEPPNSAERPRRPTAAGLIGWMAATPASCATR